jgi:predicted Zn finger-like uncharacterized protein
MLTTCPECQTTFRVTQAHLGLRRGLVRCGHCGVVFNAYDSLLAELVAPPNEPDQSEDAITLARETSHEGEVPELVVKPRAHAPEPPAKLPPQLPPLFPAEAPEPVAPAAVGGPLAGRTVSEETSESILLSELPTRVKSAAPGGRRRFIPRVLAALLLGGLLLLQLLIFLRADLAAALPSTRPLLQALCRPLGCVVPLPRQLDKTAIAASSLEHDGENNSRARLTLLLSNRSGQAQTWPYIVLTLTDVRDAPVAQRVFAPREYLAQGAVPEAGMAAGEEQEIRLDLDTGTLAATGYALDLAYR